MEDEQFPVSLRSLKAAGQERGSNCKRKVYPGKQGAWEGGKTFVTSYAKRLPRAVVEPQPWRAWSVEGPLQPHLAECPTSHGIGKPREQRISGMCFGSPALQAFRGITGAEGSN